MTDAKRKAMLYKDLALLPSQAKGLNEADTTEEVDKTKKAGASTPKDANDNDSNNDKDNDGEDPNPRQPLHSGT